MRSDYGYFCINAVEHGLVFPASITSLFKTKIPNRLRPTVTLGARRFNGPSALQNGLIDAVAPQG